MRYGWTLEKQVWDTLLQTIEGTRWRSIKLNQLYRDSVPKCSGVYIICVKTPDYNHKPFLSLYNIIYVGKADRGTLHNRFLNHCNTPKPELVQARQCFGDTLEYWFTEVEPGEVSELEARLIDCFGPPANLRRGHIPGVLKSPQPA